MNYIELRLRAGSCWWENFVFKILLHHGRKVHGKKYVAYITDLNPAKDHVYNLYSTQIPRL